jgi:hypothetical protein
MSYDSFLRIQACLRESYQEKINDLEYRLSKTLDNHEQHAIHALLVKAKDDYIRELTLQAKDACDMLRNTISK